MFNAYINHINGDTRYYEFNDITDLTDQLSKTEYEKY